LRALEEFSTNFELKTFSFDHSGAATGPLPAGIRDHGSIAVHARNLQLKTDAYLQLPQQMPSPNPIIQQLSGHQIHEELHINGATGQASWHVASPILNLCVQLDNLPPVARMQHDMIEMQLQQAEQMAPSIMERQGRHVIVDGKDGIGLPLGNPDTVFGVNDQSEPELVVFELPTGGRYGRPPMAAVVFSDYTNTVGSQFAVRACEIEQQGATQNLLVSNPEVREFFAHRIAEHELRLKSLLEPTAMNTRFNFIPLEIAEKMMAPSGDGCLDQNLVEDSPITSISKSAILCVGAFMTGMAVTYGALGKKTVSPDEYHEVSA
jgi:hypothetical protein